MAANITEYHIYTKLIFLRIIILKFMMIRQLFHIKSLCKNVKNKHILHGRTDLLVRIIELLLFLYST